MPDNPFVILSFVVLLPLVPAFLLFKLLPGDKVLVTGPLAGLQVNLSGAFGGYVALLALITSVAAGSGMLKPPKAPDPVWHVRGSISLEQDDGTADRLKFKLLPPSKDYTAEVDRTFDVDIPMADRAPIPHFYFTAKGYNGERVDLADPGRPGNYRSHMENATTLVFDEPIVLRKASVATNKTSQANMVGGG